MTLLWLIFCIAYTSITYSVLKEEDSWVYKLLRNRNFSEFTRISSVVIGVLGVLIIGYVTIFIAVSFFVVLIKGIEPGSLWDFLTRVPE